MKVKREAAIAAIEAIRLSVNAGHPAGLSEIETLIAYFTEPAEVWLVTSGEYEEFAVDGAYSSLDTAVEGIKAETGHGYIARWEEPTKDGDGKWTLVGHFAAVANLSTEHTKHFWIEPMPIRGA